MRFVFVDIIADLSATEIVIQNVTDIFIIITVK